MHDETMDRTADGFGKVLGLNSHNINRLDAGGWFDEIFEGERVPRQDDYLTQLSADAGFNLEING